MSETSSGVAPARAAAWPDTVGRPTPGRDLSVSRADGTPAPVDVVGHIVIDGPFTASGIQCEDLERGSHRSRGGDLGRIDPDGHLRDGHLWLKSRSDRTVKIAGMRVDSATAESTLLAIPGVLDAAVLPVVHDGSPRLVAQVIVVPGAPLDQVALRRSMSEHLPPILVPTRILFRSELLPLLLSGKKDHAALAPEIAELLTE